MFGLFKKKEAPKPEPPATREDPLQKLSAQFSPEELSILAVTGPAGFSGSRMDNSELYLASIGLTAWMEEDSPDIHREEIPLVTLADETLLGFLRQRTYPDFLIKCHARRSLDGQRLLLLDLPQPGFDPDLKAILEEQKKPESVFVEGLGTFVLNRRVKWFEAEVDWLEGKVRLNYDQGPEEQMRAAQETARALMADQAGWDEKVRSYAADHLLEPVNGCSAGDGEEDSLQELSREDFLSRLELDAIQVNGDGGFEFWFNDGELLWDDSSRVSCTLADGPTAAQMEG